MERIIIDNLLDQCSESIRATNAILAVARQTLVAHMSHDGKIDTKALEKEQIFKLWEKIPYDY